MHIKQDIRHQIGKIITKERNDRGLSREEVAEAIDTPVVILGLIEDGKIHSWKKLKKLLRYYHKKFDVKLADLPTTPTPQPTEISQ